MYICVHHFLEQSGVWEECVCVYQSGVWEESVCVYIRVECGKRVCVYISITLYVGIV